ncbi:hypothetical protein N7454_005896 [Penicillium verhagenii]|nr:hypothetical protein N7454_005896 [Penicillium verhagenii]
MASAAVQAPPSHGSALLADKLPVPPSISEKPHHVQTTLNFLKENEDGSPLAPSYVDRPETYFRETVALPATIHDVSGHEQDYSLDGQGFQFYYHKSQEKDFLDDEQIKRDYYPETEQLLKDATGASRIFIFDHTIRRGTGGQSQDAPELLKGRYQIINVWRPIKTILKDPLAVANAHSVPDSDLVPLKLIYPNREGETYSVKPDANIKWYYRYAQTPDLVTLIKCFDSKTDGRARRVPHTAFVNPDTEHEAGRESIEVRALVFHPDDRD